MDKEYNYNDNQSIEERRQKKIHDFHLNISQDDLAVGQQYRENEGINYDQETINSYSDDDVKARMERNSKNIRKEQEKQRKKEKKFIDRKNRRTFNLIWWLSVAIVGVMLAVFITVGVNDMLAINRTDDKTVTVKIPKDPTLSDVCKVLTKKGVIDEPTYFSMYATLTKSANSFTQGVYEIKTNMDYEAIINYLQSMANRKDTVTVTIPEGENVKEIAKRLKKAKVLDDVDEFLELCNSDKFDDSYEFLSKIKNSDKRYYKLEGYLFPDTYECYVNEDPEITIKRMLNVYETRIYDDQTVDGFKNNVNVAKAVKKSKYSLDQIMIIASIIQAEAANEDDMYNISSVIHNRLEKGSSYDIYTLDCDSTTYYPYRTKSKVPSSEGKNYKSTYDTYTVKGLPAGPICNPGLQAICAALYPNDTSYLYFCHSKGGTPYYASTLYQHNINLYNSGNR
jgi:UPF0755 protein